ncbi:MAG TPA: hypothetical protein VGI82_02640, partial [Chitinophagaceae bacterium]
MKTLKKIICLTIFIVSFIPVNAQNSPKGEIIYHLVQRSFYESNGDSIGELNGIREKLNYLQELGV